MLGLLGPAALETNWISCFTEVQLVQGISSWIMDLLPRHRHERLKVQPSGPRQVKPLRRCCAIDDVKGGRFAASRIERGLSLVAQWPLRTNSIDDG